MLNSSVHIPLAILLLTISSVYLIESKTEDVSELVSSYDKINSYIVKKLGGSNATIQIVEYVLKEKLESLKKKSIFKSKRKLEALKNILALTSLEKHDMCTDKSLKILELNDRGTQGKARANWNPESPRPLDRLIHHFFMKHAKYCEQVYIQKYESVYNNVDPAIIKDIDPLLLNIIGDRLDNLKQTNPEYLYEHIIKIKPLSTAEMVFVRNDIDKRITNKTQRESLHIDLVNYIHPPCRRYVEALKPNLFGPAVFDLELTKSAPRAESEVEYYNVLAGYNICLLLLTM